MQRSTRKLTLTAAGQAFFDRCAPGVDGCWRRQGFGRRQRHAGRIGARCGAGGLPHFFSIAWVAEFLGRHPRVRLDFD